MLQPDLTSTAPAPAAWATLGWLCASVSMAVVLIGTGLTAFADTAVSEPILPGAAPLPDRQAGALDAQHLVALAQPASDR